MFQHLDPGRRHRRPAATPATLAFSGALHLVTIAVAIHLTVTPTPTHGPPFDPMAEEFTMLSVVPEAVSASGADGGAQNDAAIEEAPEVPETPADITGSEVPSEIPPVEASLAVNALLPEHPGRGPDGPSAGSGPALVLDSVIVLALQSPFRFDYDGLEPIDPPSIRNRWAMSELLADLYPRRLRFAGISGMVRLRIVIDERGRVEPGSVRLLAADREEFAMVALRVVGRFQFSPARYRGEPVPMVIELPISWVTAGN